MLGEGLTYDCVIYAILYRILGEELNLLGRYEFDNGGVTENDFAIREYFDNNFPRTFKFGTDGQGLECVISSSAGIDIEKKYHGGFVSNEEYLITIDQHNHKRVADLTTVTKVIYSIPAIKPLKQPMFRQRMNLGSSTGNKNAGEVPARVSFYSQVENYVR